MASGDESDRTERQRRAPGPEQEANPTRQSRRVYDPMWDIDPAEIDRYLSGRPARDRDASPPGTRRTSQSGRPATAEEISRLRRAVSEGVEPTRQRQPPSGTARPGQRTPRSAAAGREQFAPPSRRAPSRETPAQPTRRPAPQRPEAADLGPDEELYSDDPYIDAEYDDEWAERPVRRSSMSRPQVRISRPNLPRLTMPSAVANAPLANDTASLALIGIGLLGLAVMAFTLSSRLDSVPELVATHVSASGALEDVRGRDVLWRIPLLATMLMLMNIVAAWFFSTIDRFAARFMLGAGLLVQFVAWVALIRYLW